MFGMLLDRSTTDNTIILIINNNHINNNNVTTTEFVAPLKPRTPQAATVAGARRGRCGCHHRCRRPQRLHTEHSNPVPHRQSSGSSERSKLDETTMPILAPHGRATNDSFTNVSSTEQNSCHMLSTKTAAIDE
eukprot:NODE_16130_length_403_cov_0.891304_g16107_i0.p1 GENE.NODE_16130_length_403_cov_0.891304_g16107_i0~~NODE_16130_length_403_cov_0.891304_g16107_i0.p1  ORF type:complete len:133 (-),score=23.79 NODE_16130_length_403_cov_0.891304_g16107_i0:4-402(-)